jgi:hypothetical protein
MVRCKAVGPLAFAVAVAAMLVTARAQAPAQDAAAAALLAKHRAYVGWQFGDGSFPSMRITGDVTDEKGEKTESFVMLSKGLVYHNTYTMPKLGNITEHTGFTGNLFWRSDENGFTTPVYGDYAKYLASFTVLQQEGTSELPAAFVKNETIDGKSVGVVRVTLKNGDPIDCYVDPATGAYVKATIDPDGSYETTVHIVSYHDVVTGKKMMASFRIDDGKALHSYEAFEPNAAISGAGGCVGLRKPRSVSDHVDAQPNLGGRYRQRRQGPLHPRYRGGCHCLRRPIRGPSKSAGAARQRSSRDDERSDLDARP